MALDGSLVLCVQYAVFRLDLIQRLHIRGWVDWSDVRFSAWMSALHQWVDGSCDHWLEVVVLVDETRENC
jgi:hypothetical protein